MAVNLSPEIDKMTLSQYKAVQLNDLSTSGRGCNCV